MPMKGCSDTLGPHVTEGSIDFDSGQILVNRKFDNGILFTGIGMIDAGTNLTSGSWKIDTTNSEVKNDFGQIMGLEFPDGKKLIGGWKCKSNNDELNDWVSQNVPKESPLKPWQTTLGGDGPESTPNAIDPNPNPKNPHPKDPKFNLGNYTGPDGLDPVNSGAKTPESFKKEWLDLSKALGFIIDRGDDPSELGHQTNPRKGWKFYNIDGTMANVRNEMPFQIENIKVDPKFKIVPMQGQSELLGPYKTEGFMFHDSDGFTIERKFEIGIKFSGTGTIIPEEKITKGNWKLDFQNPKLQNLLKECTGLTIPVGKGLVGSWVGNFHDGLGIPATSILPEDYLDDPETFLDQKIPSGPKHSTITNPNSDPMKPVQVIWPLLGNIPTNLTVTPINTLDNFSKLPQTNKRPEGRLPKIKNLDVMPQPGKNDINLNGFFNIDNLPGVPMGVTENILAIEHTGIYPNGELIPVNGIDPVLGTFTHQGNFATGKDDTFGLITKFESGPLIYFTGKIDKKNHTIEGTWALPIEDEPSGLLLEKKFGVPLKKVHELRGGFAMGFPADL